MNPIALERMERLFRRNERAVIEARLRATGTPLLMVPVGAILVASIRLRFLDTERSLREFGSGVRVASRASLAKGAEMGWFEHWSTLLVFLPSGVSLEPALNEGRIMRAGEPLACLR